jgi:PEP-CTERM motif
MFQKLFGALALSAFVLQAGVIITGGTSGSTVSVGLITDTVTGANMGGLVVTGTFASGIATCVWAPTGGLSGGCTATNGGLSFTISQSGDTINPLNTWNLTTAGSNLLTLLFNGQNAGIIFDRTLPVPGTNGSSLGLDATGTTNGLNNLLVNGTANYINPVALGANAALGDVFSQVSIAFASVTGGGGLTPGSNVASWAMDTDRVIPEPATWAMLGSGLLAAGWLRRRK